MDTKLVLLREKSTNESADTAERTPTREETATQRRGREKQSAAAGAVAVVRWWCAWTLECTTTSWLVHSGVQLGAGVSV